MKLIDHAETVVIVTAANLEPGHPDAVNGRRLCDEITRRGEGGTYRRAVLVSDIDWNAAAGTNGSCRSEPTPDGSAPTSTGVCGRLTSTPDSSAGAGTARHPTRAESIRCDSPAPASTVCTGRARAQTARCG